MTTADDDPWAPLPAGAEQHRPGESVEVRSASPKEAAPKAAADAGASEVAQPAPKAEASPGNEAAQLAALRELAARAAQQPKKPSSLVGAVLHREQRQRTARPAKPESPLVEAHAEQPSGTASEASLPAASRSVVPLGVVGGSPEAPPPERDPREQEPWFLQLPAAEQQRLRAAWRNQHERLRLDVPWRKRERNRRSTTAMAGFVVVGVLGGSPMILALCAGGLCAIAWRYTRPDRFGDPFVALLCYYVVCAIAAVIHGGVSPSLVFDSILVAAITSLLGFEGEIRATGGFGAGR
jgi:hypothetical protein